MDDFSLTNSNCELSAREIPGDPAQAFPIFFPRATNAFRRAHELSSSIKTLLPAWSQPRLSSEGRLNVERTEIENFQLHRLFVRSSRNFSRRDGIVARGAY